MARIPSTDPVLTARSQLAHASKRRSTAAINEARRRLSAAKAERAIIEALASEPPITAEDRKDLAALLLAGGCE